MICMLFKYLSIYRFMILSLEDEEDQEELQDAGKIFFGKQVLQT